MDADVPPAHLEPLHPEEEAPPPASTGPAVPERPVEPAAQPAPPPERRGGINWGPVEVGPTSADVPESAPDNVGEISIRQVKNRRWRRDFKRYVKKDGTVSRYLTLRRGSREKRTSFYVGPADDAKGRARRAGISF